MSGRMMEDLILIFHVGFLISFIALPFPLHMKIMQK